MVRSLSCRTLVRLALVALALLLGGSSLQAGVAKQDTNFALTRGDFREVTFKPGAPGQISLRATWNTKGAGQKKDVALNMKLFKPDGSVALSLPGGSPLVGSFNLSSAEFAKFKGQNWKVRISHDVPGEAARDANKGLLTISFQDGVDVILDTRNAPIDLAGQQAQTDRALKVKNVPGTLAVTINFKDAGKDNKKLTVQILRQDGSVKKTASINRGDTITTAVSAADLAAGTNWTIRLLNPERREIKGITFLATYKAN
jgi:hypothetical protein